MASCKPKEHCYQAISWREYPSYDVPLAFKVPTPKRVKCKRCKREKDVLPWIDPQ